MEPRVDPRSLRVPARGAARIRDRVQRAAFGPTDVQDSFDGVAAPDDDFERSSLLVPPAVRPKRSGARSWRGNSPHSFVALLAQLPFALRRFGPQRFGLQRFSLRPFGRLAAGMALVLLMGLLAGLLYPTLPAALLTGLQNAMLPSTQPDSMLVAGPLSPFSGWRVGYVGEDGRLYIATTDGRTTLAGPKLPGFLSGEGATVASASPDGHRIAYASRTSGLAIMDLTGALATPPLLQVPAAGTHYFWSPDGSRIAVTRVDGTIATVDVATGRTMSVAPRLAPASLADLGGQTLVGWRDAAHLIVAQREYMTKVTGITAMTRLELVDARTGRSQPLAALADTGLAPRYALSPDGSKLLAYGFTNDPALGMGPGTGAHRGVAEGAPALWLIDCADGSVRPLTHALQSLDGPVVAAVWNGDGSSLYVATLFASSSRSLQSATYHVWILSTAADYALSQAFFGVPLAWMPGAGTLVFGIVDADAPAMSGFVRLWALTYTLRGPTTRRLINGATEHLSFLGFVRTT